MTTNPVLYRHNLRYFAMTLGGIALAQAGLVYHFLAVPVGMALLDAAWHWLITGATAFFVAHTLSYYHPGRGKVILSLVTAALLTVLSLSLADRISSWIIHSPLYDALAGQWYFYRFSVTFLILLSVIFICLLWYRLGEKDDAQRRKEELERIAREAELLKLRQQMQPHFLFNSLNSINALIGRKPQEARTMVQHLSDFLRGTLKREDQKWVSLSSELDYLKLYLDIEEVRFGHRLQVSMHIDEETGACKLPPLLLQPLMENAIKFGLYGTTETLVIKVEARLKGTALELRVENPFDPDTQAPAGSGFGLSAIQRRLFLIYGRSDLLKTQSIHHQFTASLLIPQQT